MLGMNKRNLLVKFIGKSPWYDHLYKTDLTFQPNQVREMPEHFARKFLHHIDMFQLVEKEQPKQEKAEGEDTNTDNSETGDTDTGTDTENQDGEGSESGEGQDTENTEDGEDGEDGSEEGEAEPEDDTAAILENSQAKNEEEAEEDASNLLHDTLAQVNQMSQPALVEFALERYDIKIPKRTKVDEARATVTNLVNQYGVL